MFKITITYGNCLKKKKKTTETMLMVSGLKEDGRVMPSTVGDRGEHSEIPHPDSEYAVWIRGRPRKTGI